MNELLQELVGQRVRVYSTAGNSGYGDEGILEAFDGQWLRLRRDGETLFFCVYNIRLLKPV